MIVDELRDRGFGVIEAANADEAVTLLQTQAPVDLVFTDVRMPGAMDGIGLVKLVRKTRPELKVVVASGDLPADVCQTIDAFFRKPYDANIVAKRVEDLLDAHCVAQGGVVF